MTPAAPSAPLVEDTPEQAPPDQAEPVTATAIGNREQALAAIGTTVRISGTAENAKLAAIVIAPWISVYCLDLDSWPDEVQGQQVEVTGQLNLTDQFQAQVSKDGSISQGTAGGDWTLHGTRFELLPDE